MSDSRASYWSITINNPTEDDKRQWAALGQLPWVKKADGQLEKGKENGTVHIQGYVATQHGRFLTKLREALPRAHVEVARNPSALVNYTKKEDTRVGKIEQVKTAGPADVQNELYQELLYNGRNFFKTWRLDQESFEENLENHKDMILKYWETLFDAAISRLIRQGYYGVEFAAANQQIRVAFKKYLPDILYRCHKQHEAATQECTPPPSEARREETACLIEND